MKKYFLGIMSIVSIFSIIGCGSNSKLDYSDYNDTSDIDIKQQTASLSISYETTECDAARGLVSHFHIHAVDLKSNLPVENIPVSVSLVNGVKVYNNEIVHMASGALGRLDNNGSYTFSDKGIFFLETDVEVNDNLIIFPSENRTNIAYLGGWNINDVSEQLLLDGNYTNIPVIDKLTYIIGNEERLLGGDNGSIGDLATAHIELVDTETDVNGYAYFDIVYDFVLAGHTVSVEAHGKHRGKRVGIAEKIFLRMENDAFIANEKKVPNNRLGTRYVTMSLRINPSCSGDYALMDTPVSPQSFEVEPADHCRIDYGKTEDHTDGHGTLVVAVQTDGNVTAAADCTVSWNGGPGSLYYEY